MLEGKRIEVLPAVHTVPAVAYAIAQVSEQPIHWVFSGDTGHNPAFWQRINAMQVGMLGLKPPSASANRRWPSAACICVRARWQGSLT